MRSRKLARWARNVSKLFRPELSLVVPTYNVDQYIDDFFQSVFDQSVFPAGLEVIIVDDGSTDNTAKVVAEWQERRPKEVRYIHQENRGLAEARNTGLKLARGRWVSFPDPDDFLDRNYFRHMLRESREPGKTLALVANWIFFHESTGRFEDSHPLRARFSRGRRVLTIPNMGDDFFHSVNNTWIRRRELAKSALLFDGRVRPTFEDGHLLNRLFIEKSGWRVVVVPEARYYYRKRLNGSSLVDTSKTDPAWYIDQLRFGYADLFQKALSSGSQIPVYLQRLVLYEVLWRFEWLLRTRRVSAVLTEVEIREFEHLLGELFAQIEVRTIEDFSLGAITEALKAGWLWRYKFVQRRFPPVYLEQFDDGEGLAQFSVYHGAGDAFLPTVSVDGEEVNPTLESQELAHFCGELLSVHRFFWVPVKPGGVISFRRDGSELPIYRWAKRLGTEQSADQLQDAVIPGGRRERVRREIIARGFEYRDCWVLMDSGDRADDNAEHLYRHLLTNGLATNAYFVLAKDSKDWNRLESEGFKLLVWGSVDHIAAQMNASILASSHTDPHIRWPVDKAWVDDLARFEFVFLQHGVIIHDLADWLNGKPIRIFVTSTREEAESISSPSSSYRFSEREVVLTGLPRHDSLLKKATDITADHVLIAPTWRRYLTTINSHSGIVSREPVPDFGESEWAKRWSEVLHSEELRRVCDSAGKELVWAPHPNMSMYKDIFDVPEWIRSVDVRAGNYQDLLASAAVAVTDYSSAVFDVAFLDRPIVYFQFDHEEVSQADHVWRPGYFDYSLHGFGPVCQKLGEVVDGVEKALTGLEDPVFSQRRQKTFAFRDGRNCERVFEAIERVVRK